MPGIYAANDGIHDAIVGEKMLAEALTSLMCHKCLTTPSIRGGVQALIDIRLTTQLAEPVFDSRFDTTLEQQLTRLHAPEFIFHIHRASLNYRKSGMEG